MKHTAKITAILLGMFVLTQLIGLYVVDFYSPTTTVNGVVENVTSADLPYGMETPEPTHEKEFYEIFISLIIAFVIAISLVFLLTRFHAQHIMKLWFFAVVTIALGIAILTVIPQDWRYASLVAFLIALPLSFMKIYRQKIMVHNFTELFIYPGIAAVFVPLLNIWTVFLLLIIISIYDMWAVWHSGIMQKMAKYQMDTLKTFSGFFVPYASDKVRKQIKKMKSSTQGREKLKTKKFQVDVAILGGGDIVFPIITAGVFLKAVGYTTVAGIALPLASLCIILGATGGLAYLFFFAEKKKFYPAMPYITTGIALGALLSWLLPL